MKGVTPLEATLLIGALALPLHLLVTWHIDREQDPTWLRHQGIVVVRESALEAHSDPIGEYDGHPIWGSVTFMGMHYRFDRIAPPRLKEKTGPGELYLEPGLVYVTD